MMKQKKRRLRDKILSTLVSASLALGLVPGLAFADPTASGEGLQDSRQSYDSAIMVWDDNNGDIDVNYDTTGGTWTAPDDTIHNNGSYLVTIPKLISYQEMNAGVVNTSDDYTVNVKGILPSGKQVFISAETGKTLTDGTNTPITEETTRGKTIWSADETYGSTDASGRILGTNTTDTIKLTGMVNGSGEYVGYVQYNATIEDAPQLLNHSSLYTGTEIMIFRSSASFDTFQNVEVDGSVLDAANYDAVEGSTKITLHDDYMQTLEPGTHTLKINNTIGSVMCTFTISEPCAHEYSLVSTTDPTCTDNGEKKFKCSNCGNETAEVITALGHDLQVVAAQTPSCTQSGWREYSKCSRCEYTEGYESLAAIPHPYTSTTTPATCDSDGETVYTCPACGDSYSETIPALGHDLESVNALDPTCTDDGYTAHQKCNNCEYTVGKTVLPALGHDTTGTNCSRCGINILSYQYTTAWNDTDSAKRGSYSNPDGNVIWWIDAENCLNIAPENGIEGCLMTQSSESPFKNVKTDFTSAYVHPGVFMPGASGMFSGCSAMTDCDVSNLTLKKPSNLFTNTFSLSYMFSGCTALQSANLAGLNVDRVSNFSCMFGGCSGITNIDLSNWGTLRESSFEHMFNCCYELSTLNMTGTDTSNVTNMNGMFNDCRKLANIPVLDTRNVTNMNSMFSRCLAMTTIDLSNFDTHKVTSMCCMFSNSYTLESLILGANWDTSQVTNMGSMFCNAEALTLDCSSWNVGNVDNYNDFSTYADGVIEPNWTGAFPVTYKEADGAVITGINDSFLTHYYSTSLTLPTASDMTKEGYTFDGWYDNDEFNGDPLTEIEDGIWAPVVLYVKWVSSQTNLGDGQTIDDYENGTPFAVYSADDESLTFYKRVNVPTNDSPFEGKTATEVYSTYVLDKGPLMGKATYSDFEWKRYDNGYRVQRHDFATVTFHDSGIRPNNLSSYLSNFKTATTIDVSRLDISGSSDLSSMFNGDQSLTNIVGLDHWNTSHVTNMSHLFDGCAKLESLLDIANWDVSNVENMLRIFRFGNLNAAIQDLDISNWHATSVTNVSYMFGGFKNISTIDMSNFDFSHITTFDSWFYQCKNLHTIYVPAGTDLTHWNSSVIIFDSCNTNSTNTIIGQNGTKLNEQFGKSNWAVVDGLNGKAGVFSVKNTE